MSPYYTDFSQGACKTGLFNHKETHGFGEMVFLLKFLHGLEGHMTK
jgi:hypothetical protein